MTRRILTIAFACVALAAMCAPALAGKGQLSVFQDDTALRGSGDDARTKALDELDTLGVDVVKVMANWRTIAPGGETKAGGLRRRQPRHYRPTPGLRTTTSSVRRGRAG